MFARLPQPVVTCMLLLGMALPPAAWAQGDAHSATPSHAPASAEQYPWGRQGDPKKATRSVRVTMSDAMRFDPSSLMLRRGETVTFVVHNSGKLKHEFVIGTQAALDEHAALMRKHPAMEHDAPYTVHVAPGKTRRFSWTFTRPGDFLAGCLEPGHWEAGMKAALHVEE